MNEFVDSGSVGDILKVAAPILIGILGKDWAPANNIVDVVESLRFLLSNPNPDDPLNTSAANMMKADIDTFKNRVNVMIQEHAGWDQQGLF